MGELHDGGHLLDGEVGDGAEVAAGETLGGFGEGGVGLDAEGGLVVVFGGVGVFGVHEDGFATHEFGLLPVLLRRVLQ